MSILAGEVAYSTTKTGQKTDTFFMARVSLAIAVLAGIAGWVIAAQPSMELVAIAPMAIQIHFYAAVGAAGLGLVLMAWRKGRTFHRALGWLWVYAVASAVVSSFWIRDQVGNFTWIHLTSIFHGATLALAVAFAIRRNIKWHRRFMFYTYWVGVVGAVGLTFIPERLLWRVFFG